jgi:hypothetical protein
MRYNLALCVPQHKFRLEAALDLAKVFPYQQPSQFSNLDEVMVGFLSNLEQLSIVKDKTPKPGSTSSL